MIKQNSKYRIDCTYADGEKGHILAPGTWVGQKIIDSPEAEIAVGNCATGKYIPVGTQIHSIELHPGKGGPRWFVPLVTAHGSWLKRKVCSTSSSIW